MTSVRVVRIDVGAFTVVGCAADTGEACEMQHLAIDAARQRQGLGGLALSAIVAHVKLRRPHCREMSLTVHSENRPAQSLYSRVGFADTGVRRDDEPVWVLGLKR